MKAILKSEHNSPIYKPLQQIFTSFDFKTCSIWASEHKR